ncbi:glutathione peroxidase [Tistrella sp.]|uniref:glutathione peroxidase n=1 Tax=Tistrella sp. TaxID=2024861 RepID=UPI000C8CEDB5|nr:glutathione peroxidase [Tistrella sp.]MAD37499.1 glutathione peroxidase [Tistrella sp.]
MTIGRILAAGIAVTAAATIAAVAVLPASALPRSTGGEASTQATAEVGGMTAYDFSLPAIDGGTIDMAAWRGQPLLIVNTASLSGFTRQYEGLVKLWQDYRDRGLVVVGVPSGDFGGQEYDEAGRTREFCTVTYGVDFPLAEKQTVRGNEAHPLFRWLTASLGDDAAPRWNFHKYLIDAQGRAVKSWPSRVEPTDREIVSAIEAVLPRRQARLD